MTRFDFGHVASETSSGPAGGAAAEVVDPFVLSLLLDT